MIKLNIYAMMAHGRAIARGDYSENSSPMKQILLASRAWRGLHQAQLDYCKGALQESAFDGYSRREQYAVREIVRLLEYLQHIGCKNIEELLRKVVESDDWK